MLRSCRLSRVNLPGEVLRSVGSLTQTDTKKAWACFVCKSTFNTSADMNSYGGVRPVLIVQNDIGNKHSPTVIAAAITSQREKARLPTHISLDAVSCGLSKDSVVLLEQVRTLDKQRLRERMGNLSQSDMNKINKALFVSFGLQ